MLQINIKNKSYGSKIILKDIDIKIDEAGIYGIIGKNGEGKTTFFKCIMSLSDFEGSVTKNEKPLIKNQIAWCPTESILYDELTASEFSEFYRRLLKIEKQETDLVFNIDNNRLIKTFSTGMKKKTYLNAVFQKEYAVYIFDEPFNGLDLESNYLLMNYIKNISKKSIVFISSHILESLYINCNKIFLVQNKGIKVFEKENFLQIENELFMKK